MQYASDTTYNLSLISLLISSYSILGQVPMGLLQCFYAVGWVKGRACGL